MNNYNKMKAKWFFKAMAAVLFFIVAMGYVTTLLWNELAVDLFNAPEINFFQALGLLLLGRLLTGGFGHRGWKGGHHPMRNPMMKSKWNSMSDDERSRFMNEWKNRNCNPFAKDTKEDRPDIESAD